MVAKEALRTDIADSVKSKILEHWNTVPGAQFAIRIIDSIVFRGLAKGSALNLRDILLILEKKELSDDVASALAILTQSEDPVLCAHGELRDDDGRRYRLSPSAFQRVLVEDKLNHPATSSEISDASCRVFPIFEIERDFTQ